MSDVLNVIELIGDTNILVHSFVLPERSVRTNDSYNRKVAYAEVMFANKGRENGMAEGDISSYIDDGFYQQGDYKLYLVWTE